MPKKEELRSPSAHSINKIRVVSPTFIAWISLSISLLVLAFLSIWLVSRISANTRKTDLLVKQIEAGGVKSNPNDSKLKRLELLRAKINSNPAFANQVEVRNQINELISTAEQISIATRKNINPLTSIQLLSLLREQNRTDITSLSYVLQSAGSVLLVVTAFAAIRNLNLAQKNLSLAERKQVSELVAKATDHLGSDRLIVRVGGINSLIWCTKALDHDDRSTSIHAIVSTLAVFVEESLRTKQNTTIDSNLDSDVSIVLNYFSAAPLLPERVIMMRCHFAAYNLDRKQFSYLDLSYSDLSDASLVAASFSHSNLDHVNFTRARLDNVSLYDCSFYRAEFGRLGRSDFEVIDHCSFECAAFSGRFHFVVKRKIVDSNFNLSTHENSIFDAITIFKSRFQGAIILNSSMRDATLSEVDFNNAILKNSDLSNAKFDEKCKFEGTDFENVNLSGAIMRGLDLSTALNLSLEQLLDVNDLSGTKLSNLILQEWQEVFTAVQLIGIACEAPHLYLTLNKRSI